MTEEPVEAPAPPPEATPGPSRCWRCSAPHDPFQEYCLECGARLVPLRGGRGSWRTTAWTRESPFWFWATFLALALIALGAAAIVLAARDDDSGRPARSEGAAGPTTSTLAPAVPTDVTTAPLTPTVTIPETTAPTATNRAPLFPTTTSFTTTGTTTSGTTTTGGSTGSGRIISWPAGRDGYTVIIASVAKRAGREPAEAKAREAVGKGLTRVGILNSDNYTTLVQGYWVVFQGTYDSETAARSALGRVRTAGYPVAYIREIAET